MAPPDDPILALLTTLEQLGASLEVFEWNAHGYPRYIQWQTPTSRGPRLCRMRVGRRRSTGEHDTILVFLMIDVRIDDVPWPGHPPGTPQERPVAVDGEVWHVKVFPYNSPVPYATTSFAANIDDHGEVRRRIAHVTGHAQLLQIPNAISVRWEEPLKHPPKADDRWYA